MKTNKRPIIGISGSVHLINEGVFQGHKILGEKVLVNSFHHQAVKEVAKGFKVVAVSKDNVVEAIEKEGEDFVLGIQWHPEMMIDKHDGCRKYLICWWINLPFNDSLR